VGRLKLTSPGILLILAVVAAGGIFLLDLFYLSPYVTGQKESAFKERAAEAEASANQGFALQKQHLARAVEVRGAHPSLRRALHAEDAAEFAAFCDEAFAPLEIDLAWLTTPSGDPLAAWSRRDGLARSTPGDTCGALAEVSSAPARSGMLSLADGVVLFARQEVLAEDGRPAGSLWAARRLDRSLLRDLSPGTMRSLVLVTSEQRPKESYWLTENDSLTVTWPAMDAIGRPVGYFRAEVSAGQIVRQATVARRMILIVLSLCVGLVLLVILGTHMLIAGPVVRLLSRLQQLEQGESSAAELARDLHGEPLVLARRLESAFDRLAHQSKTDPLTGLANRRHFEEVLECFYHQARRYSRPLSVILVDIDFFKAINDTGGHQLGDDLLKVVARAIEKASRKADLPARFGGDEFAILLPETPSQDAGAVADRIGTLVRQEAIDAKGLELNITCSIGVADLNAGEIDSPAGMVALADRALYAAKENGRNQWVQAHDLTGVSWKKDSKESGNVAVLCKKLAGLDTQFKDLFLRAIEEVVEILERRDPNMADHARKVQHYAELISKEMELPDRVIKRIRIAATLHDIGMIAMPDSILLCPTRLDDRQTEAMRKHPLLSVRIMEGMEFLEQEIPAVRYHHERYDGRGYPEGLSGATIPLTARILAVADAFDAMTTPRTYRGAMTVTEAMREMKRGGGSQFDPAVVEALLSVGARMGQDILSTPETGTSILDMIDEPATACP